MRLYNVHTLLEAQQVFKENFSFEIETIHINDAYHRVIAEDIVADIDVPSFRRSTVDGYAVVASDTNGATDTMPMLLDDLGEVMMGEAASLAIKPGELIYVPTGGMVPDGADAMVMIEYTERFSEDNIAILKQSLPLQHIVGIGADVKKHEQVLAKHQKLEARHLGVLAAVGVFRIKVYKKLKAVIISTGDELITTQQELSLGEVFDINTHTLKNRLSVFDIEVIESHVLKDNRHLIKPTIQEAVEKSDITLISGGSSVGEKDYTADIIDELSTENGVLIHGLAIKPGKPTIVGKVQNKLVLGLPGHPVSALIVMDQMIRMYLTSMHTYNVHQVKGYLTHNVHAAPGKETFVMVQLDGDQIIPVQGKSGMITMMSNADGYIRIGEDHEGLEKGDLTTVYLLD